MQPVVRRQAGGGAPAVTLCKRLRGASRRPSLRRWWRAPAPNRPKSRSRTFRRHCRGSSAPSAAPSPRCRSRCRDPRSRSYPRRRPLGAPPPPPGRLRPPPSPRPPREALARRACGRPGRRRAPSVWRSPAAGSPCRRPRRMPSAMPPHRLSPPTLSLRDLCRGRRRRCRQPPAAVPRRRLPTPLCASVGEQLHDDRRRTRCHAPQDASAAVADHRTPE
mmetsp:Transcript_79057/g.229604  ORF Transcript_79057/g.229604 Transcript_79057/m.229604 type:complete len:219 (+) Transcript_79057:302-958(+)